MTDGPVQPVAEGTHGHVCKRISGCDGDSIRSLTWRPGSMCITGAERRPLPSSVGPSAFPPTCHWPRSARLPHSPPAAAEEQVEKPWDPPHKQTSTKGADELRGGRGNDVVRHGRKGDDRFAFALEAGEAAGSGLPSGGASRAATAATSPLRAVPKADGAGRSRCPVRPVRDRPGTDPAATGTTHRAARRGRETVRTAARRAGRGEGPRRVCLRQTWQYPR